MIDLFFYSSDILFIVFFALIILFAAEGAYLCVTTLSYRFRLKYQIFGEALLLIHIAMIAMTVVTSIINRRYGIINLANFDIALYFSGILTVFYFAVLAVKKVKSALPAIFAVFITLPVFADIINNGYIIFLLISIVVLSYRIVDLIKTAMTRQKHEINNFSIIDGLNTLHCGVLFCDLQGYIFLTNEKMMELALEYVGGEPKNGLIFWDSLSYFTVQNVETQVVEGDILLRTPKSAWRFSRQQFQSRGKKYFEITAVDVTESIGAYYTLEEEHKKLERQSSEINNLTESIEALRREREYSRIRGRVHDVLGQRLTAIQRLIQSSDEPDYKMLLTLSQDAILHIKERGGGNSEEFLLEICNYFKKIGLEIKLHDPLPEEEQIAFLFLSVLREASTNAIKHASATKVFAKIIINNDNYRFEITNNGERPKNSLIEGGGLFGIRNRVETVGGTLKVEVIPEFSLIITIGRGQNDDKSFYS